MRAPRRKYGGFTIKYNKDRYFVIEYMGEQIVKMRFCRKPIFERIMVCLNFDCYLEKFMLAVDRYNEFLDGEKI